jgi:hypothetical protein
MADDDGKAEARKVLMGQAKVLGLDVDGRWSVETLAEKVRDAQDGLAAKEQAAVVDAADTWVFPVRDCFLGTEKQPAGRAFRAPKELYLNWKATGAARMADSDEIAAVSA